MTTSRLKEYKENNFNAVLRKAEKILEAEKNQDPVSSLGKKVDAGLEANAKVAQDAYNTATNARDTAELAFDTAAEVDAKLKNVINSQEDTGKKLASLNALGQETQKSVETIQQAVQAGQLNQAEAQKQIDALRKELKKIQDIQQNQGPSSAQLTKQDVQLGQNYLNKALTAGDISKKIDQLLPKISPTFKGENFTITKITPMKSNDPSTLQFKVNFALQGGSKQANKLLASQDPAFRNAVQFLETLDFEPEEEQLSEGVMGAIGSAAGKVVSGVKQGINNLTGGFTQSASTAKASAGNYQAAQAKEPMLGQYLQKILTQALQDAIPINGKTFDIGISNVKTEIDKQAAADQLQTAADEAEKKAQNKQKAKDTLNAVGKGVKTVGKGIAKGAKAVADNVKAAAKPGDYGQNNEEEIKLGGFDEKLHEGLLVKNGSFIIKMTLANAPTSSTGPQVPPTQPTPQPQPAPQSQQQSQANPQSAQPATGAPGANNINIYNNGYGNGNPQQQGQQVRQGQQNGTPFWWDAASKKQQKKYVKNMMKTGRQNSSGNGWLFNNTYGSQMGNSSTTANGWK